MSRAAGASVCTLVASLGLSQAAVAQGLPVIPGAAGFGITTPAGRGGDVYRVTNLNASGSGSLSECLEASGPRVCVFEVSGAIWLPSDLAIRNPNITVAGQTAPSPGIELRNGGLLITASDVLIQHIRVRVGDDPSGPSFENRDALRIEGQNGLIENVVVANSSFSWSTDELSTLYYNWDNIGLINNIFSEPLHNSFHPEGDHGLGLLWRDETGTGRVSAVGNILAHIMDRNPKTLTTNPVIVNNIIYNVIGRATYISTVGQATVASIVGNLYIDGPDSNRWRRSIHIEEAPTGSQFYIADNQSPDLQGDDQWSMVDNTSGVAQSLLEALLPPVWPGGLLAMPTGNDAVHDWVLANAGARPADRDPVDQRIVNQIRSRTGQYVNCVADDGSARCDRNAGGWPPLAENSRPLVLPNNPDGDDDGDGYTNLEEWLHQMARDLEGDADIVRPAPPTQLQIS